MAINKWITEAGMLAAYCKDRVGDTLAQVDYLDRHPEVRLALEYTLPGRGGCVYEEVEDHTQGDTLPYHLRRWMGRLLRQVPGQYRMVHDLLVVLRVLYPDPGATVDAGMRAAMGWLDKATTKEAGDSEVTDDHRVKALLKMTLYYKGLVEALPEIPQEPSVQLANLSCGSLNYRDFIAPRPMSFKNVTTQEDVKLDDQDPETYDMFQSDNSGTGAMYRKQCIHDPNQQAPKDWVFAQSKQFKSIWYNVRKQRNSEGIAKFRHILHNLTEKEAMGRLQLKVLWESYRTVRDSVRKAEKERAANHMSEFASRLVARINREDHRFGLGKVGQALFHWCKGEEFNGRAMPQPVSSGEWSIIWDEYRSKKAELAEAHAQEQAWINA